ncbi:MAG: aconitase X swivel domain-containing protein, partial [Pseudomonas fluorescens]
MPRPISLTGRSLVAGAAQGALLFADVGLSFWGGVDPYSGEVIDRHHPLSGEHLAGRVLAIPSGRGSCTGSSVLMELISNGHAPAALVLAEPDEILTLGVLVAQTIFERSLPVLCIGREAFAALRGKAFARVEASTVTVFEHLPGDAWQALDSPLPTAEKSTAIELTELDQALLDGEHGKAAQVAMQIVLRMAELQGAHHLVDVTQAHIDGCIY